MIHFGQSIPPFIQTSNNHTNYCLSRKTISLQLQWRQICCYPYEYADSQNYLFFYHQFSSTNKNRNIFTIFRLISTSALLKNQNNQRCLTLNIVYFSYVFILTLFTFALTHSLSAYSWSIPTLSHSYYSHVSINCIFIIIIFFALTIHFYYIYFNISVS